jgi:hypothetical protein
MIRRTLRLAAALIAAFTFASVAQAAPTSKHIRHRVKHARGTTLRTATPRRPVVKKKKAAARRRTAATTASHRPAARKNPSTKPR